MLLPELGFEFIPVRHVKRDRGPLSDRQRPSCAQFGFAELLCAWDTNPKEPLNDEQEEENRLRFEQALAYFDGALALKQEAEKIEIDFPAPFDISCADTCHQQLTAYDQANKTDLVMSFHLAVLKQLQENNQLDEILQAIGYSAALPNISPASSQNGNGHLRVVPESGPTVPAPGDNWQTLAQAYPLRNPEVSIRRLQADLAEEKANGGNNQTFALRRFGHPNGQQLSRHIKRLKAEFEAHTGIAV